MSKFWLLTATALAGTAFATPGLAQETTQAETQRPLTGVAVPDQGETATPSGARAASGDDTVVVTGSRIRRAGFDTLEPAIVVSNEYLQARGLTNVADALNEIPSFGVGVTPEGGQSGFGVGQNFASRFGLGSARTLTLVNGRRFVSTNAPSIFGNTPGLQVDLNVIPAQLVDRVENIAIGGAPTYGSDAIAGTVNVILKRNFDGVTLSGLGGITSRGDNGRYNMAVLAGKNFGPDGRGNITVAGSYDKVNGVLAGTRSIFRDGIGLGTNPNAGSASSLLPGRTPATDGRVNPDVPFNGAGTAGLTDGIPSNVYIRNTRIFSLTGGGVLLPSTGAFTLANGLPRGFGTANTLLQFNSAGDLVTFNPGTPFGPQNASGGDGFNLVGETSQLTSSLERITGNILGHYELTDGLNAFFEGTYYRARGRELIDQSIYNATLFGGASASLNFQANDPRLTPQARAQLASLGVTSFRLSRASRDLVNNNASSLTEVYRGVAGLEGNFNMFGRAFNFEATANYGKTNGKFYATVLNQQRFVNAINVTTNAQGQIVCNTNVTAATNVAPGGLLPVADSACVPLDVFGENRPSAAARAYVTARTTARSALEQQVYNVNFGSSSLFTIFSNPVGFNIGYEHRNEQASFSPDAFQLAGLGRAVPIGGNEGEFNTDEGYGEISIPLLSRDNDVPLIRSLTIEAKARYVDNSINGGFWAYTYGGRYEPVDGLELRGNYTRSLRSPSVVEAFTPSSPAFSLFNDPCDVSNINAGVAPAVRQRNCAAFYASYGLDGANFNSLARVATVPSVSGGNPNLANEEGRSYTFGAVLRPRFIPRFRLAVDWNRIRISGNIASLTAANIAEGCYDNPDFNTADVDNANSFCSLIRRDRSTDPGRNGQLSIDNTNPGLITQFVNGSFIKLQSLTAEAQYNFPLDGIGLQDSRLDLSGTFYYVDEFRSSNNGVTIVDTRGTLGQPTYSGQANIGLTVKNFGIDFQANYQSGQQFDRTFTAETRDILRVSDYWLFNLSTSVLVGENSLVRFTVSNLADRDPPFPLTTGGFGIYDYLGRRFAISFQHKL